MLSYPRIARTSAFVGLLLMVSLVPAFAQPRDPAVVPLTEPGSVPQQKGFDLAERLQQELGDVIGLHEPDGVPSEVVTRIIRGDVVSGADQERLGLVTVNGGCSGALLRNDWAISAGHCFSAGLPRSATVALNGTIRNADRVYVFGREALPAGGNDMRGPDVSLIHVTTPFSIGGSTTGFRTDIARLSELDLRNRTVLVYGQGLDSLPGGLFPALGAGIFRLGVMQITPESTAFRIPLLEAKPIINPGPVCFFGDSGGPMYVTEDSRRQIVSIVQTGDLDCNGAAVCDQTNTVDVRSCQGPKLYQMWEAIPSIIDHPWNPADTSALFDVSGSEWVAIEQISGSVDTNDQPWAAAARSANSMCFNRGYVGGLMNGHQLGGSFGLACAGMAGARWRDATSAEVAGTPWPFDDVNTALWAQANRAAARLCEQDGFVGGHFNGHMAPAPSGGNLMGLICYGAGAQRFNVSRADLSASFDTPGQADWAEAGRRANNLCQFRGFRTGFLNGHFFPDGTMGLICH